jgi:MoxR-like ATPase
MNDLPVAQMFTAFAEYTDAVRAELHKVIVGQDHVIDEVLTALLAGGNVLLEGVPGLGKTLLVRTLADVIGGKFSRVQFTPDLMPADILGVNLLVSTAGGGKVFEFRPGPIFANLVLADEINRATPKTQSALLEAMAEHNVTVEGVPRPLPSPFFVLATQNPLEQEGTYPLPEAQLDRFLFKVYVPFPNAEDLIEIGRQHGTSTPTASRMLETEHVLQLQQVARRVPLATHVERFAARLVLATHPDRPGAPERVKKFVRFGASPRALLGLHAGSRVRALMNHRVAVSCEDIRDLARPVLAHRIAVNFEADAQGVTPLQLVDEILAAIPDVDTVDEAAA